MKKIAIFTEGQTELIFIREFLLRIIDPSKLSLECWELLAKKESLVPYSYSCPYPEIHFKIINVHGDESVLSSIKENEKGLIEKGGFEKIFGLRDLYCEVYQKRSPGVINQDVTQQLIQGYNATIKNMSYSSKITLHFAVMEIEAWFLAMYNIFQKIAPVLTVDFIKENLSIDLKNIDPQKEFYKPERQVNAILGLCGRQYNKKRSDCELIASNMELSDFNTARENNRCSAFDAFYHDMLSYNK